MVPMTLPPLPWFRDAQPLWVGLGAPHRDQASLMKKPSLSIGGGGRESSVPSRPVAEPREGHGVGDTQQLSAHCVWPSDPVLTEHKQSPCPPSK